MGCSRERSEVKDGCGIGLRVPMPRMKPKGMLCRDGGKGRDQDVTKV